MHQKGEKGCFQKVNCKEVRRLVEDLLDGSLKGARKRSVQLHLDHCRNCREFVKHSKEEHKLWFRLLNEPDPQETPFDKVKQTNRLKALNVRPKLFAWQCDGRWLRRVAAVFFVMTMAGAFVYLLLCQNGGRNEGLVENEVLVHVVEDSSISAEELELLKARYATDRSFVRHVEPELIKYEPGVIDNPGAPIRVLDMASANENGRHLRPGDRVWRETIEIGEGSMRFEVGSNCIVTVHAPAKIELRSESAVEIVRGGVFLDVKDAVTVDVAHQRICFANSSVGLVVSEHGETADMLVTDGVVRVGRDGFFKPRDGARIFADGKVVRYRSHEPAESVRGQFLASVPTITISGRKRNDVF